MTTAASLLLPSGRQADTPLEIASVLIRNCLSAADFDSAKQHAREALKLIEGIDSYTAMASSNPSGALAEQVKKTMEHDWDAVYENVMLAHR